MAQEPHAYVKDLKADALDGKLIVSWTTKAGFSCQDIVVQLSTDSLNFINKATYFGICGDTTEQDYVLTIDSPFLNQRNYIRLDLGTFGYSYIIAEDVIYVQEAQVIPHPVQGPSTLHFRNPFRTELAISILDSHGRIVWVEETTSEEFDISSLCLDPGMHYYSIRNGNSLLYQGRISVISGSGGCR